MSVNKFGRYSGVINGPSVQGPKGPKGEGFNFTNDGNYDIQYKRICNVAEPLDNGDVVNLIALENSMSKCLQYVNLLGYDGKEKRIVNVVDPVDDGDVVNRRYFLNNSPLKSVERKSYSLHQFNLKDVAYPVDEGDATNLMFFKENTIVKDRVLNNFDAKNIKIVNVADPQTNNDVVNLNYLANILADLSYAVYVNIRKKQKKKITKEQWKRKVIPNINNCDWGDLFGASENSTSPLDDEQWTLANK